VKRLLFKTFVSLLLLIVTSFSFSQNTKDIRFTKNVQSFKKVDEGHIVKLTYSFTYSGETPLQITPPKVDCSCTTVIIPDNKIITDTTYSLQIVFDTKDKIGFQKREILIPFTDLSNTFLFHKKLTFKGVVKASKATKEAYKLNK